MITPVDAHALYLLETRERRRLAVGARRLGRHPTLDEYDDKAEWARARIARRRRDDGKRLEVQA